MRLFPGLRNDGRDYTSLSTRRSRRPGSRDRGATPGLERLEGRTVLSQIGLTVSSLADAGPGTLRAAILAADAGSHSDKFTIGFKVTGTIDLQTPLPDLNSTIAVLGPGASALTVERAAGASFATAIMIVDAGQTAGLSGLTIANGNAGGIMNSGTLTVSGSTVAGNSATVGGGIYNTGTLTITTSTVSGNSAASDGGGVWDVGDLAISGSTLSGNSAGGYGVGGGLWVGGGTLTVVGSTVSGNSAGGGGGIYAYLSYSSTVSDTTVAGNSARIAGGGVFLASGPLTVKGCTLVNNSAGVGGGIANYTVLTVSSSTLTGNSAGGYDVGGQHHAGVGGGIYSLGGTTVRDSLFSNNSADLGGGIYNDGSYHYYNSIDGVLGVKGSTFTGNTAGDSGGGVYNTGVATFQECTLTSNSAGSDGGGLFNAASGTLTLADSVVRRNTARRGADLFNLGSATLHDSTVDRTSP